MGGQPAALNPPVDGVFRHAKGAVERLYRAASRSTALRQERSRCPVSGVNEPRWPTRRPSKHLEGSSRPRRETILSSSAAPGCSEVRDGTPDTSLYRTVRGHTGSEDSGSATESVIFEGAGPRQGVLRRLWLSAGVPDQHARPARRGRHRHETGAAGGAPDPHPAEQVSARPLSAEPAAARVSTGRSAAAISVWSLESPVVARGLRRGGCVPAGSRDGQSSLSGSLTGRQRPQSPSHTRPRNAWSDDSSSPVWRHPATMRNCLTVKQVDYEQRRSPLSRAGSGPRCGGCGVPVRSSRRLIARRFVGPGS